MNNYMFEGLPLSRMILLVVLGCAGPQERSTCGTEINTENH